MTRAMVVSTLAMLTLSASVQLAVATGSPEEAVVELFDAVEAMDAQRRDALVCDAQREAVAAAFDVRGALPPEFAGMSLVEVATIRLVERAIGPPRLEGETAIVPVSARLTAAIDGEVLGSMARLSIGLLDANPDPNEVEALVEQLRAGLAQGRSIATEVALIDVGGAWLVCDTFEPSVAVAPSSTEGSCAYLSVAELNAVATATGAASAAYVGATWDPETLLCTYDRGPDTIGTLAIGTGSGDFDVIAGVSPGGSEVVVEGRRAVLRGGDLIVELDEGYLIVLTAEEGSGDGQADLPSFTAAIAAAIIEALDDMG